MQMFFPTVADTVGWLPKLLFWLPSPFHFSCYKDRDLLASLQGMGILTGLSQYDQEAVSLKKANLEAGTSLGLDKVVEQPYLLGTIYL